MTAETPQVILFGSIGGDWRERHIIPVLDELGVSYYHPTVPEGWTEEDGTREAEVMEQAEVIVMVFNNTSPGFGGLVEAGWAALGSVQRGQTFILCLEPDRFIMPRPWWARWLSGAGQCFAQVDEYAHRARFLVREHARRLAKGNDRLIVVERVEDVARALRQHYSNS